VRDVAKVEVGHEIRHTAVTADGEGEAVLGLGFMLGGENSHTVTTALAQRLREVQKTLAPGIEVAAVYERTELVDHVLRTVRNMQFKRMTPVIAKVGSRTPGIDFRYPRDWGH
jgi:cobalt-zinc-cadmium resistance protein CzcA